MDKPNPKGSLRRLARLLAENWRDGWQAISCLRRGYARRKEWMMWAVSAPVGVLACLAATLWHTAHEWPEEPGGALDSRVGQKAGSLGVNVRSRRRLWAPHQDR